MGIIVEDFKVESKATIDDVPGEFIRVTFNIDIFEPVEVHMGSDQAKSLIESLSKVVF